jgi:hypothetical protein
MKIMLSGSNPRHWVGEGPFPNIEIPTIQIIAVVVVSSSTILDLLS